MRRQTLILIALTTFAILSCSNPNYGQIKNDDKKATCSSSCKPKSNANDLSCKKTTPEVQKRKEAVLKSLKAQMIEKKELKDGYAFKFPGTDKVLDELNEFIKNERECCSFFTFNLLINGNKSGVWLELRGEEGSKDFIRTELGL